jgi:glycosyltransferase involved in cell wall biosynthesis
MGTVNNPLVSIVLPMYNSELYIRSSVDSILNQTYSNIELIVIDDASTDKSVEIVKAFEDERIILLLKKVNTGYTDSLNLAIERSKGAYIMRMDSDDYSIKERVSTQLNYMENNPDVLVLGSMYKVIGKEFTSTNQPITFDEVKLFSLIHSPVSHPTAFIRRSVFHQYNLRYDKNFEPAEDYDLWTRILDLGKIENLPEVLLYYRRHEGQVSNTQSAKQNEMCNKIRLKQIGKLVDFKDKSYDIDFASRIILKRSFSISSSDLMKIDLIIQDIWDANKSKKIYNEILLRNFLKNIWVYYLYKVKQYSPRGLSKILKDPIGIKSMGISFTGRFIIKTLIFWKGNK